MSFFKVEPGDVETFTIVTNPYREYISSSTKGVTGSVHVYARRSPIEKEVQPISSFVDSMHNDIDLSSTLKTLQQMGRYANVSGSSASMILTTKSNFPGMVQDYLNKVNAQSISARKQKVLDIVRFTPSFAFTSNTVKKLMIKDQLSSYYRTSYPSAHWAYTNYNCLNFFTCRYKKSPILKIFSRGGPITISNNRFNQSARKWISLKFSYASPLLNNATKHFRIVHQNSIPFLAGTPLLK
jgi:hypothetical protein